MLKFGSGPISKHRSQSGSSGEIVYCTFRLSPFSFRVVESLRFFFCRYVAFVSEQGGELKALTKNVEMSREVSGFETDVARVDEGRGRLEGRYETLLTRSNDSSFLSLFHSFAVLISSRWIEWSEQRWLKELRE